VADIVVEQAQFFPPSARQRWRNETFSLIATPFSSAIAGPSMPCNSSIERVYCTVTSPF
jgi:hypothetical protein